MAKVGRPRTFDRDTAIEKAMGLFWEKGYESTSLLDLRQQLGNLSAASFYSAFGSKKELFQECFECYMRFYEAMLVSLDDHNLSPKAALTQMLIKSVEVQTMADAPTGCMMVLSGLNCGDENTEIEALTSEARTRMRHAITRCIQRGIDQKEICSTQDAEALALIVDSFLKGISIESRDGVSAEALNRTTQLLLQLLH